MKEKGIEEADIMELQEIIEADQPDSVNKRFGNGVNTWIQKMTGKVLDGSWQIGIGAAGTLLADSIKQYYGF